MMRQQAGGAVLQRLDRVLREFLRTVGGVRRASDRIAAGTGDHVVDRRNIQTHDRQDRRMGWMSVDHCVYFGAGFEDIAVESPFARWALLCVERPVEIHEDDLLDLHGFIGRACRRDEHPAFVTQADISRGALIDAQPVHLKAGLDDGLTLCPVVGGGHQLFLID